MSFWARASSLAALFVAFSAADAHSFGRFGYTDLPDPPGFTVNREGFRVSGLASDSVRFNRPIDDMRVVELSNRVALYSGSDFAGRPSRLRVDLASPGFEAYFPLGVDLRFVTLGSPLVSWSEATTDGSAPGEMLRPTAPTRWILLHFPDPQPPIGVVFLDGEVSAYLTGGPGAWSLRTTEPYQGWVRFVLPRGQMRTARIDVATLGQSVQAFQKHETFWLSEAPNLTSVRVQPYSDGIEAIWQYDGPGAMVPVPALMARHAGYGLQILSGIEVTEADLHEGPQAYLLEPRLVLRFPIWDLPPGAALGLGAVSFPERDALDPLDYEATTETALYSLLANAPAWLRRMGREAVLGFPESVGLEAEPATGMRLPYSESGDNLSANAAIALLYQSREFVNASQSPDNPFLAALLWRRDWLTWRMWAPDVVESRRSSALVSVATALSPSIENRLEGAMFHAGLIAERALITYRNRRGFPQSSDPIPEPLFSLRRTLYDMDGEASDPDPFALAIASEVKVAGERTIECFLNEKGLLLEWVGIPDEERLALVSRRSIRLPVGLENGWSSTPSMRAGRHEFVRRYGEPGRRSILLTFPDGWDSVRPWPTVPRL